MAASTSKTSRSSKLLSKSDSNETIDKCSCIFCDEILDNKKPAAQCDKCNNWVCFNCSKLSKTMYVELSKQDPDIEWSCKVCKSIKSDLKSISINLAELKDSNEKRLMDMETRIGSLENSVRDTVTREVELAKDDITRTVQDVITDRVDKIVESKLKEMDDRKNRSNNLILFNVKQSTDKEPLERKNHDLGLVNKLFKGICPDTGDIDIKACFRLKNKKKDDSVIFPLKIVLNSKQQRKWLLTNSSKITNLMDTNLKPIIIVRDLTVEQRKRNKSTQDELERRREEGENVEVRFGEVVTTNPDRDSFR